MDNGETQGRGRHRVVIALGTNRNTAAGDIAAARSVFDVALDMMRPAVDDIIRSEAILTAPVGIVSPMFCNQLIICYTDVSLDELEGKLKAIERRLGRSNERANDVAIDIDILKYDDTTLRPDDWKRDYVATLYRSIDNE